MNKKVIVATTENKIDESITQIAIKNEVSYFCGDEDNVLKRYIDCAKEFNIENIIRITADNIFIQPDLILPLFDKINSGLDYISYNVYGKNVVLTHWGIFGEFVTLNALKKVQRLTDEKKYQEHVTYYIYTHPNEFNIELWDVPHILKRSDIRLTIDTIEDFNICKKIVNYLNENNLEWDIKNILYFIDNNPVLKEKMKKNIENIVKSKL